MADNECFGAGSITGAVIGTFVATLILLGIIWLLYSKLKKRKLQKSGLQDLVIVEEGGGDKDKPGTYDNPAFVDEGMEPKKTRQPEDDGMKMKGQKSKQGDEGKKMPWGPFRFFFKSRGALDDSVMQEPQVYNVALKGHDFTGLGFNICGNMKDGIYVKDVMQRGPAAESKHILPGDQITSMTVSFKQMVLEDAVTLLSYASPYQVNLELVRHGEKSLVHKGLLVSSSTGNASTGTLERVVHPFFKSQSIDDLRKVGKEHLDHQVIRGKKQANTMGSTNESSSAKIGREAHLSISVDEVDSPAASIVPQIKMSKPEPVPRAKAKVTSLKKEASAEIVEAISPVVKMSADFEKMVEEHSITNTKEESVISVETVEVEMEKKMTTTDHVEIDMSPEMSEGVKKPERGKKKEAKDKDSKGKSRFGINLPDISLNFGKSPEKEKTKETKEKVEKVETTEIEEIVETMEEKDGKQKEKGKDKKKAKSPPPDANEEKVMTAAADDQQMPMNAEKDKDMKEKEAEEGQKKGGFGFHLKFPNLKRKDSSSSEGEASMDKVDKDPSPSKAKSSKKEKKSSRPTSPERVETVTETSSETMMEMKPTTMTMAMEEEEKSPKKFHMHFPKLPKFGAKQTYSFENSGVGSETHVKESEIPKSDQELKLELTVEEKSSKMAPTPSPKKGKGAGDSNKDPKIKKLTAEEEKEAAELRAGAATPPGCSYGLYPPEKVNEIMMEQQQQASTSRSSTPAEKMTAEEMHERESKPGLMSKLRDLKDKVTGKHPPAEGTTTTVTSDAEEDKAKADKKAAKEKAAAEAKKEKEKLKAEKKAKKAAASKKKAADSSDSSSSSSDESETEEHKDKGKKKKASKSKDKTKSKKEKKAVAENKMSEETASPVQEAMMTTKSESKSEMTMTSTTVTSSESGTMMTKTTKEETMTKEEMSTDSNKPVVSPRKPKKKKGAGESSSSSSSSSSESDDENKPKKPKRSNKRKAPVPPMASEKDNKMTTPQTESNNASSKTPESGRRSASFGDLSSLQPKVAKNDNNLERTMSVDMASGEKQQPSEQGAVMTVGPMEDLSADPDSKAVIQRNKPTTVSLSSSSSSETLKSTPSTSVVHVFPKESQNVVTTTSSTSEKSETVSSQTISVGMESLPETTIPKFAASTVTISSPSEVERAAAEAVDEILAKASNGHSTSMSTKTTVVESSNVSVTAIESSGSPMSSEPELMVEGETITPQLTNPNPNKASAILRGDSKTRLMQTVADANTIKVNPISPLRKDSSMSSSSSSVDSDSHKNSSTTTTTTATTNDKTKTIEISAQELDSVMMSHADFLVKTDADKAKAESLVYEPWVYVESEKKDDVLNSPHSDPEPSNSSSNDDDDLMVDNRNGSLSPSTPYKMETEYKYATSEMQVTSSPVPSAEGTSPTTTTTVYATTMTLPQKTVTQITVGEPNVEQGRIVSKITLEAPDLGNEADLPTLKLTK